MIQWHLARIGKSPLKIASCNSNLPEFGLKLLLGSLIPTTQKDVRNVYDVRHEWTCHSMYLVKVDAKKVSRREIGTAEFSNKPYSASILNISAMSYCGDIGTSEHRNM
jgi:hypothetical protein